MTEPADRHYALIVVDPLNDFTDPTGALYVPLAETTFGAVNNLIGWAARTATPVVFVRDSHPTDTPHFASNNPDSPWPDHCITGTWGADINPAVHVPDHADMIFKGTRDGDSYSGFGEHLPDGTPEDSGLNDLLRLYGTTDLIIVGYATDWCVKATALDGRRYGYTVHLVADAVAAVNLVADAGKLAIGEMVDAEVRVVFSDGFAAPDAAA